MRFLCTINIHFVYDKYGNVTNMCREKNIKKSMLDGWLKKKSKRFSKVDNLKLYKELIDEGILIEKLDS